ncbi:hypothetical protein [Pseudalkalibacillus caeni]|uniref:Uncharacterized protein n=1 Tax=Exobacillus caeni TaxID=2574798 RepID=A0A5R9F0I5_9BACL|nr:hypothetical protein [Pseudalkalibacillus caeni]TLS34928.1 hypothetical protein FCL54_23210 [Pseudalkalibacillus caeni]
MNEVVYEKSFDANEWFVLINLLFIIIVFILPRIFNRLESVAYFLYGVFIAMFFDHTISVGPWDFYDVNDSAAYQLLDFLSYLSFGTYSYLFMYLYVRFKIKGFFNILYIAVWTVFSLGVEWVGLKVGLYHYDKGFQSYWSISIYLLVQSSQILIYHLIVKTRGRAQE